ncbi:MAG: shikimate kinase, partial [Bacteroidota bacterium]
TPNPEPHPVPPRVYLTGFMASGKSTVGPLLADRLGYRFVDLDWLVEAQTGRTILDLFAEGEAVFRAAEAEALRETTRGPKVVVSTGGGTLAEAANLHTARHAGVVVWLRASPATTVTRLGDAAGRPMLAGDDGRPLRGEALDARIRVLLGAREPFYAQADLVADADGRPEAVARDIAERLRRWSKDARAR